MLWRKDFRALFETIGELQAIPSLNNFTRLSLVLLQRLIPQDLHSSYNLFSREGKFINFAHYPNRISIPDQLIETFKSLAHQHPFMPFYQRRNIPVCKISSCLTRREFHRLDLYNEYYKIIGIEHQLVFGISAPDFGIIGLNLNRSDRDFSNQECLLLKLAKPYFTQVFNLLYEREEFRQKVALLQQGIESQNKGYVLLSHAGEIELMSNQAREWISFCFKGQRIKKALSLILSELQKPGQKSLTLELGQKGVQVQRIQGKGDRQLLCFTLKSDETLLPSLDLSLRETEILKWVAKGKTNKEIALILKISPRTIQKHLENIFKKLRVETRVAASALFLGMSIHNTPSP